MRLAKVNQVLICRLSCSGELLANLPAITCPSYSWRMNGGIANRIAQVYAALGNREKTLEWLEWEPHSFAQPWLINHPQMDTFREDPRFQALFRRHNLTFVPGQHAPVPLTPEEPELPAARPGDPSDAG